ncbi:MAG: 50S ribosomal protein L33 [Oligoflexia bacterium]|nr:50S ribosomal protein L33 [Oligoflexia bacterium]
MAKKSAKGRAVIHLECTTCRSSGIPGVSRYPTRKNKKNTPARLELNKYCRYERKYTIHKEVK